LIGGLYASPRFDQAELQAHARGHAVFDASNSHVTRIEAQLMPSAGQ